MPDSHCSLALLTASRGSSTTGSGGPLKLRVGGGLTIEFLRTERTDTDQTNNCVPKKQRAPVHIVDHIPHLCGKSKLLQN